jgi:hypothetical protein
MRPALMRPRCAGAARSGAAAGSQACGAVCGALGSLHWTLCASACARACCACSVRVGIYVPLLTLFGPESSFGTGPPLGVRVLLTCCWFSFHQACAAVLHVAVVAANVAELYVAVVAANVLILCEWRIAAVL